MIQYKISIFLVLASSISCLSNADLFFLSDAQLFNMGVDQFVNGTFRNQLGGCIINNGPHACSSYAQVCYHDGTCSGLPDLIGSGCLDGCWGPPNTYLNYQSTKLPICTGDVTTNGANMLRIGLLKGYCGSSNDTSLNLTVLNSNLFFLSDAQLFQKGIDQFHNGIYHNQLGACAISDDPYACSHYAKVCQPNGNCIGLPDLYGSGCLDGCWGPPNTYLNYQSSKIPICTGNVTTNGANMLRIGLIKGYCGVSNFSSNTTASSNASSITNSSSTNSSSTANSTSNVTSNSSSINNLSTHNNSAIANVTSDQSLSAKTVTQPGQGLTPRQLLVGWAVIVGLLVVIIILMICLLFRFAKSGSGRLSQKSIEYDQDTKYTAGIVNNSS